MRRLWASAIVLILVAVLGCDSSSPSASDGAGEAATPTSTSPPSVDLSVERVVADLRDFERSEALWFRGLWVPDADDEIEVRVRGRTLAADGAGVRLLVTDVDPDAGSDEAANERVVEVTDKGCEVRIDDPDQLRELVIGHFGVLAEALTGGEIVAGGDERTVIQGPGARVAVSEGPGELLGVEILSVERPTSELVVGRRISVLSVDADVVGEIDVPDVADCTLGLGLRPPTTLPAPDLPDVEVPDDGAGLELSPVVQQFPGDCDGDDAEAFLDSDESWQAREGDGFCYVLEPAAMVITSAEVVVEAGFDRGTVGINLTLGADDADLFDAVAAANIGRQLAIVFDGEVLSAPFIQVAEFGGSLVISGRDDDEFLGTAATIKAVLDPDG